MALSVAPDEPATAPVPTGVGRGRSAVSATEQARREAWGKQAGAKVAAAYRQLQEAK